MSRKRVIYQSEALFVGSTGTSSNTAVQIHRVQSANYSFDVARTDINQFGQLARIDSLIIEQPTVALDFTYYPNSGSEENLMGFKVGGNGTNNAQMVAYMLDGTKDVYNYYIVTSTEGIDTNLDADSSDASSVIGLGNMSITSYSTDGAVGDFVSTTINAEGLNMVIDSSGMTAVSDNLVPSNPAVTVDDGNSVGGTVLIPPAAGNVHDTASNPIDNIISALQPKDVSVGLTALGGATIGIDATDLKLQSFSLGVDLGRTPLEKLGSRFAFSREIDFPVTATLDFSANLGDMGANSDVGNSSLESIVEDDSADYDIAVCVKPTVGHGLHWVLMGAKLDSQSFSSSIGDNKSVDMSFSTQIGGPADTDHGLSIAVQTAACSL